MLPTSPYLPTDPAIAIWDFASGDAYPREFTGWKDESLSWKENAYLHAGLNPTQTYWVKGPDATKMLNYICVNNIERLKVGSSTHAILTAPSGNVMAHGMLLRLAEDEYISYWLQPVIGYHAASGQWDVQGEDLTGKKFLFQLAGPRALEILEAALGESYHDLKFLRHRPAQIGGKTVGINGSDLSVIRIGMAGGLAYEVHGDIEDAHAVYEAIIAAGEPFGIRRLGSATYLPLNHTENGFPQVTGHFNFALTEDPGLSAFFNGFGWPMGSEPGQHWIAGFGHTGSLVGDITVSYSNPIELGWGHLVSLDHEFVGREALEPLKANPTHKIVTLDWNVEDILDVERSQYEPGEEYELIKIPADHGSTPTGRVVYNDQVLKDGTLIGKSMGRMYSYYYRKMISLATIEVEHAEIGTELTILWGKPGTRQKEIRATVTRYPLYDLARNEKIDVSEIPEIGK